LKNSDTTPPHNKILHNYTKNPAKPCQNPQFSDVIALAGNSGLPAAFKHFFNLKPVVKKRDQPEPAQLQAQIPNKIGYFR
jgi:hypothetical protein